MPNGAQAQTEEEEGSGGESQEEWESDGDEGDEDAGSDEEEEEEGEEEVAPPRSERRSKLVHDPAVDAARGSCLLCSRPNVLGRPLRRRLRKRRSNPEWRHQNRRRPCRR